MFNNPASTVSYILETAIANLGEKIRRFTADNKIRTPQEIDLMRSAANTLACTLARPIFGGLLSDSSNLDEESTALVNSGNLSRALQNPFLNEQALASFLKYLGSKRLTNTSTENHNTAYEKLLEKIVDDTSFTIDFAKDYVIDEEFDIEDSKDPVNLNFHTRFNMSTKALCEKLIGELSQEASVDYETLAKNLALIDDVRAYLGEPKNAPERKEVRMSRSAKELFGIELMDISYKTTSLIEFILDNVNRPDDRFCSVIDCVDHLLKQTFDGDLSYQLCAKAIATLHEMSVDQYVKTSESMRKWMKEYDSLQPEQPNEPGDD